MRLAFEYLEDRTLAAVTAVMSGGILSVTGDESSNSITLRQSGQNLIVNSGSRAWSFPITSIGRLEVDLRGGNDLWNGLVSGFKAQQIVRGGAGNDAITTSEGNDIIDGGDGNDTLIPWAGTDTVYGGNGNDQILLNSGDSNSNGYPHDIGYGGNGEDRITAGSNDFAYGEEGNDILVSAASGYANGASLDGGNGDDQFYTNNGSYRAKDAIFGGAGRDRLVTFDLRPRGGGPDEFSIHGIEVIG